MFEIIAIVGMCGSGKSIASDYLVKQGYQKIYFGGVIYNKMTEAKIDITPQSQTVFRENLRKQYGMGVVAMLLLPEIEKAYQKGNVVLDGVYSWDEYKVLQEKFPHLKVIAVIADKTTRYQRLSSRKERPFSKNDAIKRDINEIENSAKGGPIAFADYYLLNNGTMENYIASLEAILKHLKNGVKQTDEKTIV